MLYAVVTQADTSSNQAIKDLGQWRCGYSNLGKFVIKYVADLPESPASRHPPSRAKSGQQSLATVDLQNRPLPLIPTYILLLFNFVEAGISVTAGNLSWNPVCSV